MSLFAFFILHSCVKANEMENTEQRVDELLDKMTLTEKIGQMVPILTEKSRMTCAEP